MQCGSIFPAKRWSPRLLRPWEGPYTITKVINDVVYRAKVTLKSKAKVVHKNQLWKYAGENSPTWFSSHQSSHASIYAEPGEESSTKSTPNGSEQTTQKK